MFSKYQERKSKTYLPFSVCTIIFILHLDSDTQPGRFHGRRTFEVVCKDSLIALTQSLNDSISEGNIRLYITVEGDSHLSFHPLMGTKMVSNPFEKIYVTIMVYVINRPTFIENAPFNLLIIIVIQVRLTVV